jgi:hypothetical protein
MNARNPILPTIIVATMMYFPSVVSCAVIPAESPTVLMAETTSNNRSSNGCCSVINNANNAATMYSNDNSTVLKALVVTCAGICFPKTSTLLLPVTMERRFSRATAKVVVLIPPPVEAGDAPIPHQQDDQKERGKGQ